MTQSSPAVVVAGLSGGSGKTLCALGIVAALHERGMSVAPFKKGPDFIDPAWLSKAASVPCRNLDIYLTGEKQARETFLIHGNESDICIVEGNRGLYDGLDKKGSFSTANLAKALTAKVILVIDCTKMTGTAAAVVLGCQKMDPAVTIAGVVLNRVGGERHRRVLREAIRYHTGVPVVGCIPKLRNTSLFERHLGLLPPSEHRNAPDVVKEAGIIAEKHLDLDRILKIAGVGTVSRKHADTGVQPETHSRNTRRATPGSRVGIIRDRSFSFYYPENLEALQEQGAEIIELDSTKDRQLPELDLLYIGGGFPETQARHLEKNVSFRRSLRDAARKGLRVYAECGGVVYLGRKLRYGNRVFSMTGVLPMDFDFSPKPKGHGYTAVRITRKNPFFKTGTVLRGHEFHYTAPVSMVGTRSAARVERGFGFDGRRDCLVHRNVFATYTHLHAHSVKNWARCLLGDG